MKGLENAMEQKSGKENRNAYFCSRQNAGLTREKAEERVAFSKDRMEKIEKRGALPHPDEVLAMARAYKDPKLCNYYCSHDCPIGQTYIPEIKLKNIAQITLEMLDRLNQLVRQKDRLIEITVDGVICEEEQTDFQLILETLNSMSMTIDSLKLWAEHERAAGRFPQRQ